MTNEVKAILEQAAKLQKGDWNSYAQCKRMLCDVPLTREEYEHAVTCLCDTVGV